MVVVNLGGEIVLPTLQAEKRFGYRRDELRPAGREHHSGRVRRARRALAANRFDVAVLDVGLALGSGLELLHELRDSEGDAIPLVVFSPQDANPRFSKEVRAALIKSRTSIDSLLATLRRRLAGEREPENDRDIA
jgi:DNA-binding response OmpR family regulator